jgi:hypothetical protein
METPCDFGDGRSVLSRIPCRAIRDQLDVRALPCVAHQLSFGDVAAAPPTGKQDLVPGDGDALRMP